MHSKLNSDINSARKFGVRVIRAQVPKYKDPIKEGDGDRGLARREETVAAMVMPNDKGDENMETESSPQKGPTCDSKGVTDPSSDTLSVCLLYTSPSPRDS